MTLKVAMVTGAGAGLGREVARGLLADGWTVVGLGRTLAPLEETFADDPERGIPLVADVSSDEDVERAFATVERDVGRLDVLFNNAGVHGAWTPFEETDVADWRHTIDVNLTGSFLCARAAFRLMLRQSPSGGRIINNGSISAQVPRPNSAAYTASKSALTGLTRAVALEGRKYGIACGQIDFGNVLTDMTTTISAGVLQADLSVRAEPTIDVSSAAKLVVMTANLPTDTNLLSSTLIATEMPFTGRG